MDGLCKFYAGRETPYTRNLFPFFSTSVHLTVSEVIFDERVETCDVHNADVPETELNEWLARDETTGNDDELGRHAIFRIVWINRHKGINSWSYGIFKPDLEKILKSFRIERAFQYGYTGESGIADFADEQGSDNLRTHSVFISNFFGLAWAYNLDSGTTQAVCWGDPWILCQMRRILEYQKALCGHPTVLELFAVIVLEEWIDRNLLSRINEVRSIEIRTGYHDWRVLERTPAKGDYASLSAKMSGCAATLAGLRRIARVLDEFLHSHSTYPRYQNIYTNDSPNPKVQMTNASMEEVEQTLRRRLAMQKLQIDFLLERSQIQQTALFNLIAQKDAKLNIALAKDSRTLATASKRDSSSMKTLAAVTVAFLPATFVASLFAMPLFNWDAEKNSEVLKDRFGIYWAVTVPLTITTIVIWLSWTHRQSLLHLAQDKKDRDELVFDITGQEKVEGNAAENDIRYGRFKTGPMALF